MRRPEVGSIAGSGRAQTGRSSARGAQMPPGSSDGKPRLLDFGVTDEQAWDVGLACGGKVQVFVEKVN